MTSPNGLVCFTNCLLPLEDGSLVQKDLWIDEQRGVILDAQVFVSLTYTKRILMDLVPEDLLLQERTTCQSHRSRRQHFEVPLSGQMLHICALRCFRAFSPGLMDIQINGAYGFDFSVFDGDAGAYSQGLRVVAQKIVETGVTSYVLSYNCVEFALTTHRTSLVPTIIVSRMTFRTSRA